MKSCNQIQKLIYPYLDGELDYVDNVLVEEHILECDDCCDYLNEQKRFLTILQHAPLSEEPQAELKDTVIASLKKKKKTYCFSWPSLSGFSKRTAVGTVMSFFLIGFLVFTFAKKEKEIPPFVSHSIAKHQSFLKGEFPLELKSNNPQVITSWLQERVCFSPALPKFDDLNVVLQGSSVLNLEGRLIGLVSYRIHDIPVSLLIVKGSPETAVDTSNHAYVGSRRINFSQSKEYNAVSWAANAIHFSLVSTLPRKGKESCKACHANGSGLQDLSDFYQSKI